jgi:uncharacterized protein YuzE
MMTQQREKLLHANYDRRVDVLYVMVGSPVNIEGEGLPDGIELDYSSENGSPCGVTVIGYSRNGWPARAGYLSSIVANHLSIDRNDVDRLIKNTRF